MKKTIINTALVGLLIVSLTACKKFLEVGPPLTSVNSDNVYNNDGTAISSVTGIYAQMSVRDISDFSAIGVYAGLSADEIRPFIADNDAIRSATYRNALNSTTTGTYDFWTNLYPYTYNANAAIEGLTNSKNLTPAIKQQLLGEAYFVRAFTYFYLSAIYGDVPLVLGTDYSVSSTMPRTSRSKIIEQMIADLLQAKSLLSSNYLDGTIKNATTERVRPTIMAASALLARVYLYKGEYANAETEATNVIGNTKYAFVALASTFLKNSSETIWALQPVGSTTSNYQNSAEGRYYIPNPSFNSFQFPVYLNDSFVNSFEVGDNRKSAWTINRTDGGNTVYSPYKYKVGLINNAPTEYTIMLRLAEQYLIRAEARARQNNLTGALADLNAIRNRSGLGNSPATTQDEIIAAISKERKVELFTEWGDRWFNMQRTGTINAIMPAVTTAKGGTWSSYQKLYPIPALQLQRNPALVQNPGYN